MSPQPASESHLRLFSTPSDSDIDVAASQPTVAAGCPDGGDPLADRSPSIAAVAPVADETPAKRVEVALGEIAPLLADAIERQLGWLHDFSSDTVSIDADLYEVLLAYQQMRRQNAA